MGVEVGGKAQTQRPNSLNHSSQCVKPKIIVLMCKKSLLSVTKLKEAVRKLPKIHISNIRAIRYFCQLEISMKQDMHLHYTVLSLCKARRTVSVAKISQRITTGELQKESRESKNRYSTHVNTICIRQY